MSKNATTPYGTWPSPITAELIVAGSIGLGGVAWDGGDIYWTEGRASEGGRSVLVRRSSAGIGQDITPKEFNARSRVHEYGGAAILVADGVVYFVNFTDQRIYRQRDGATPEALTPTGPWRYADMTHDAGHDRLICVREDNGRDGEPENTIVAIPLSGHQLGETPGEVLVQGRDFVASPRLSPDGRRLAWLAWDHPNMPWDGTDLMLADVGAGGLAAAKRVAGGAEESIFQPEWSPQGVLHFVSDASGWWNIYRLSDGTATEALCPMAAEFGLPQWVFGMTTYGFMADGRIAAAYSNDGLWQLGIIDATGSLKPVDLPFTAISGLAVAGNKALFVGASTTGPSAVICLDLETGDHEVIKRSTELDLDAGYLSVPQSISYPTSGGAEAHAFYYPPANKDIAPPPGEKPPLVVRSHGGPTGATSPSFNLGIQYWTSRGVAVLDVNYRGSTGYGRPYRAALDGQWGIADVDDCAYGARHLVALGLADEGRLAIRGGSAGGYTTLAALTFHDVFAAGASHYGIGDLMALTRDTHKFESRYLDRIVGPLPEAEAQYHQRSPIDHTERLSCPVIFLQGLDDRVVPPNQAEAMVEALKKKGLPVAYLAFAGEGHGFRKAENVKRALEAELYFFGRVFGFTPHDEIPPVPIANMAD
ncbi:MAG: S9 family peptidase [Alphaproteobacteria bacterium]